MFFGGVLFPGLVFGFLYALPAIDRVLFTRDGAEQHLLDNPGRSGPLAAGLAVPPPAGDPAVAPGAERA